MRLFNNIRLAYLDELEEDWNKENIIELKGPGHIDHKLYEILAPKIHEHFTMKVDSVEVAGEMVQIGNQDYDNPSNDWALAGTGGGRWRVPTILNKGETLVIDTLNNTIIKKKEDV